MVYFWNAIFLFITSTPKYYAFRWTCDKSLWWSLEKLWLLLVKQPCILDINLTVVESRLSTDTHCTSLLGRHIIDSSVVEKYVTRVLRAYNGYGLTRHELIIDHLLSWTYTLFFGWLLSLKILVLLWCMTFIFPMRSIFLFAMLQAAWTLPIAIVMLSFSSNVRQHGLAPYSSKSPLVLLSL